jgi:FtsZ-interacting cell division protein YlmF
MLNIPAYDDVKNAFLGIATEDDEEFFEVPKKEETPKTVKFSVPKPQVKVEVKEDKPEEVKEETREERMARIAAKKAAPKLKCPVEGGVFGDDYCAYDECEDCDLVSECSEASDIGI